LIFIFIEVGEYNSERARYIRELIRRGEVGLLGEIHRCKKVIRRRLIEDQLSLIGERLRRRLSYDRRLG
jgi:hypothetical protein